LRTEAHEITLLVEPEDPAPARTVVEARVVRGELVDMRVTPPERRKDVTVWAR